MKQQLLFINVAAAILLISACSSNEDANFLIDTKGISSEYIPDKSWQYETDEMYQYLKFENDSFYYDISRAEALDKGLSEKVFNWAQNNAKKLNNRVKENMKNNIKTHFIKYTTNNKTVNYADSTKILSSSRSINNKANKPYQRGDVRGSIFFPDKYEQEIYVDYLNFNCFRIYDFEHLMGYIDVGFPYPYDGYAMFEISIMVKMKTGAIIGDAYLFRKKNNDSTDEYVKFEGDHSIITLPQTLRLIAFMDEDSEESLYLFVGYAAIKWELSMNEFMIDTETN